MAEEFDIFSVSVSDLETNEQKTGNSELYSPKPDQGQDGVYKSLIRFLPNIKNPRKPYIRKYVYWLEDKEGKGMYIDSPSTIGEKCPIQDKFFKLRNSESAIDKKMSENIKRREVYYALVQIIKDSQNKELEGQIKVFKFGFKVKSKIDEELNPQFDAPTQIFDPFEGKNFELVISKKAGFANYDSCKFQGSKTAMQIDGKPVKNTQEGREAILNYLKGAPELNSFEYKAWTDEQHTKVMNLLDAMGSPGSSISKLTNSNQSSNKSSKSKPKEENLEKELADFEARLNSSESSSAISEDEDLTSFLDGIDV